MRRLLGWLRGLSPMVMGAVGALLVVAGWYVAGAGMTLYRDHENLTTLSKMVDNGQLAVLIVNQLQQQAQQAQQRAQQPSPSQNPAPQAEMTPAPPKK